MTRGRSVIVLLALNALACTDGDPPRARGGDPAAAAPDSALLAPSATAGAAAPAAASAIASATSSARALTLGGAPVDEEALIDAPLIAIRNGELRVDGDLIVNRKDLAAHGTEVRRVEPLFTKLRDQRARWLELQAGKSFPGVVIIDADDSTPALLVKSVFQTAAYSGYPNVSFIVRKPGASPPGTASASASSASP